MYSAGHDLLTLKGKRWVLRGTVAPAAAGERLQLLVFRDGKQIRKVHAVTAADGSFSRVFKGKRAGRYSVRVVSPGSAVLAARTGPKLTVGVYEPRASDGQSNALVKLLQRSLARLHYAVPTRRHLRRRDRPRRDGVPQGQLHGPPLRRRPRGDHEGDLRQGRASTSATRTRGRHVEADLSRQVLALIDGGKVVAIYHTSRGAPATPTVIGSFRVYMQDAGHERQGHGRLDRTSSAATRSTATSTCRPINASHGCLRIPIPDAARDLQLAAHRRPRHRLPLGAR